MIECDLRTAAAIALDAEHRRIVAAFIDDIPDPAEVANDILVSTAKALMTARLHSDGWKVSEATAEFLRPHRFVDCRTNHLSAFGSRVRAALAAMEE